MADEAPNDGTSDEPADEPRTLRFHYVKSNFFRVIFADGCIGGGSLEADRIRMAIFNTRHPIPLQVTHHLSPEGVIGPPVKGQTVVKQGPVRELEAEIVMDLNTAREIVGWLSERIKLAEGEMPKIKALRDAEMERRAKAKETAEHAAG